MSKSDPDRKDIEDYATPVSLTIKTIVILFLSNLVLLVTLAGIDSYVDSKITADHLNEYKNTQRLLKLELDKIDTKIEKINTDIDNLKQNINKLKEISKPPKPPKKKFERRM